MNQILQQYRLSLKKQNFSENSLDKLDFENENVDSISVPLSNDMTRTRLSPRRLQINLKRDSIQGGGDHTILETENPFGYSDDTPELKMINKSK